MATKEEKIKKIFYCPDCKLVFETDEYSENKAIDSQYRFFSKCSQCGELKINVHHSFKNLKKAWAVATGPKDTKRTSKNAYKTGAYSEEMFAPALYGKFPECSNCDYKIKCECNILTYCRVHLEKGLRIFQAYKENNYKELKDIAGLTAVKNQQILEITQSELIKRGIVWEYTDRFGVKTLQINPAAKVLKEFTELTGFSSNQQLMNAQVDKDKGEELTGGKDEEEKSEDFLSKIANKLKNALTTSKNANKERQKDKSYKTFSSGNDVKDEDVEIDVKENPF